ncbi:bifunctional phosphoribosylaminoimidazolecarboxamide formyltransferase/IMP cyclohydrolase [Lentibacillus amyloliquefaciens]|uniref:Bifunctional purine biosynthesis protein PurH n=1 Tax=Lentibacillus amyloliquefaciens TaxID=1472767 RepID=A0A0U3NQQ5_9BACI|nr:bifunctional phosphoribosylaminoimidazolecarboxamide formyltransferase/IMP cyclohydrolase [Lentibacillus amyloliquefaciens]ALX49051.1 bifunctional phosphoribosylaminoimidazolecarboxamide formyltransferase/inosine monophosphate cyclohydrolase [Lentibacillus amyloliquefaciens]
MKKQALISVSDKTGIADFAKGLAEQGYDIISTGGTLRTIQEAGIEAAAVEDITGFPEMLEGRVKTLHPVIHAGLLAKRDNDTHKQQLEEKNINPIDIVVVNLYPFKQTLDQPNVREEEIIENIDIGGPTMLRAAAKSFRDVTPVVDPDDYDDILQAIQNDELDVTFRKKLAAKVFRHTAQYDALIAGHFTEETFPENYTITYEKVQTLRYGENPHQEAAFYKTPIESPMSLVSAKQRHGKELSYNNIQDANAALSIIAEYDRPTAVAVKHMNPCGIGMAEDLKTAFSRAYDADPVSIFGGIVACNRTIEADTAEQLSGIFLEIIIAPAFTDEAFTILTKKKNIRLLELKMDVAKENSHKLMGVNGGVLIQDNDNKETSRSDLSYPTERKPTERELDDLLFAWKAVRHVKSNAIVLANDMQTLGVGAGQMNRVGAAGIALEQAGDKANGAALASDAFFPMPDTVEIAAKAGVKAIIQPGGSKRDQDSIDMCNQYGVAMVYTGTRHFKH